MKVTREPDGKALNGRETVRSSFRYHSEFTDRA
jgi:hypothetical protein